MGPARERHFILNLIGLNWIGLDSAVVWWMKHVKCPNLAPLNSPTFVCMCLVSRHPIAGAPETHRQCIRLKILILKMAFDYDQKKEKMAFDLIYYLFKKYVLFN